MSDSSSLKENCLENCLENCFKLFALLIEFLKVILWPSIIIFLLNFLQQPIYDLFESLPYLLTRSSEISVAGVSVKVNQKIATVDNPQLRIAASNLSKEALIYLLDINQGTTTSKIEYFNKKDQKSLEELTNRRLVFFHTKIADKDGYDVEYGLTELGIEVRTLIRNIIVQQFIYKG